MFKTFLGVTSKVMVKDLGHLWLCYGYRLTASSMSHSCNEGVQTCSSSISGRHCISQRDWWKVSKILSHLSFPFLRLPFSTYSVLQRFCHFYTSPPPLWLLIASPPQYHSAVPFSCQSMWSLLPGLLANYISLLRQAPNSWLLIGW